MVGKTKEGSRAQRLSTLAVLNVAAVRKAAEPALAQNPMAQESVNSLLKALGFDNLEWVAGTTGLDEQGVVNRTVARTQGAPHGLFELVNEKPLSAADLAGIPQKSTLAFAARLDWSQIYRRVLEEVGQVDPAAVTNFKRNLSGLEQGLGFDFEKGLLASLGDVWTLYLGPQPRGMSFTNLVIHGTISNHPQFEGIYQRLIGILQQRAAIPGALPFTIREVKFEGLTIYQLVAQQPGMPFTPAICLTQDHLVLAASPEVLKNYLKHDPKADSLAQVPAVAARMTAHPAAIIQYQDSRALFRSVYDLGQAFGPLAMGSGSTRRTVPNA